jgi:molybdopterin-guanine dinucleotide biosynthesis protein A
VSTRPAGAILAGGRATRLGGVRKGLLEVGGQRMIDRVAAALAPVTSELLIVSDAEDAGEWLPGARPVRDVLRGGGSAAGVHAALTAAGGPVIVVAWDLPFVVPEVCAILGGAGDEAVADAVVPAGAAEGSLEPLCAWYAPGCAPVIEQMWVAGDRSLHRMLSRVRTSVLGREHFSGIGGGAELFLNVNTAQELERAREWHQ